MPLNKGQYECMTKIIDFLFQTDDTYYYVTGGPGTGKTELIIHLLKIVCNRSTEPEYECFRKIGKDQLKIQKKQENMYFTKYLDVEVCTFTHQVINDTESKIVEAFTKNGIDIYDLCISFRTCHSLLGMTPNYDVEGDLAFSGKKRARKNKEGQWSYPDFCIVDEISMLDTNLWTSFVAYVDYVVSKKPLFKVILMGDPNQINPVKESKSHSFDLLDTTDYGHHTFLTELMRSKSVAINRIISLVLAWNPSTDSDLIKWFRANGVKTNSDDVDFFYGYRQSKRIDAERNPQVLLAKMLVSSWFSKYKMFIANGVFPIILAWRNTTVKFYNNLIRTHIFGKKIDDGYGTNDFLTFFKMYECNRRYDVIFCESDDVGNDDVFGSDVSEETEPVKKSKGKITKKKENEKSKDKKMLKSFKEKEQERNQKHLLARAKKLETMYVPCREMEHHEMRPSIDRLYTSAIVKVVKVTSRSQHTIFDRHNVKCVTKNKKLRMDLIQDINWTFTVECLAVTLETEITCCSLATVNGATDLTRSAKLDESKIHYILTVAHNEIERFAKAVEEGSTIIKKYISSHKSAGKDSKSKDADHNSLWSNYNGEIGRLAIVNFRYANTIHKSEGITCEAEFVDQADACDNPNLEEKQRIMYVGVSRPRGYLGFLIDK